MKKLFTFLLILIMLTTMSVFLVSCNKKELATPSDLSVSDGFLIWDKVDNADGYIVSVDGVEYTVGANYFELSVELGKTVQIAVKAVADGYTDSHYSEVYTYKVAELTELTKLNTPQISEITGDGRVYWSYVSNSSGYKIYKNNSVIATINDAKTTDYLLEIDTPGSYGIQVQAIGDKKNFSDSGKSNIYKLTIEDNGMPTLPSLVAPIIFYDAETQSLVWDRNRKASYYDIYLNGTKIASTDNTSYVVDPVLKINSYQVVAVGDGVRYGNSRLGNEISFPLEPESYPKNLSVKVVDGERRLVWDEQPYCLGYEVEINGSLVETKNEYIVFPSYKDGIYNVRVRSRGDNLVYCSSKFTGELEIVIKDGKIAGERMNAPESIGYYGGKVEWSEVEGADYYELLVETPYDDTLTDFRYKVDGVTFNVEETLLDSVLVFYVKACSDSELYYNSDYTKGIGYVPSARKEIYSDDGYVTIIEGEQYTFISSPTGLSYDGKRISWSEVNGASGYRLNIGEQQFSLNDCYFDYAFDEEIVVSVSAMMDKELTYSSPRSAEMRFQGRVRLSTVEARIAEGVLSWNTIQNAASYLVVVEGVNSFRTDTTFFDLSNVIEYDGEYTVHVICVADGSYYINSLRSNEVKFLVDYGAYGTESKPYSIDTIEDFALLKDNPNAYFKLTSKEYDFNNAEVEPLFVSDAFLGHIIGDGAVIKNVNLKAVDEICSFFGILQGASIKNISFDNIKVSSAVMQGIVASMATDCIIEGIDITNSEIEGEAIYSGGIIGIGSGNISNCNVSVSLELKPHGYNSLYAGGIVGSYQGDIEGCTVSISLTTLNSDGGEVVAGGIAGSLIGSIKESSVNSVSINLNNDGYAGLGFGQLSGEATDLHLSGTLMGKSSNYLYLGGAAGKATGSVSGNVTGLIQGESTTLYMGGASGNGGLFNMTVKTKLRASADRLYLGGLCGSNSEKLTVEGLDLDIQASANKGYVGGIVGEGKAEGILAGSVEVNIKNKDIIFSLRMGTYSGSDDDGFKDASFSVSGDYNSLDEE